MIKLDDRKDLAQDNSKNRFLRAFYLCHVHFVQVLKLQLTYLQSFLCFPNLHFILYINVIHLTYTFCRHYTHKSLSFV